MISRNGQAVVGFGDANLSITNPIIVEPAVGYMVGAVAGAILGNYAKQGIGTAIGSIVGGAAGTFLGGALFVHNQRKAAQEAAAKAPKQ